MASKIDPYTLSQIKKNAVMLFFLIMFAVLIVIVLPLRVVEYTNQVEKNKTIEQEVDLLKKRQKTVLLFETGDYDEVVSALNLLLPTNEDYFSAIASLENLQAITGVEITSYQIGLNSGSEKQLRLSINIDGTSSSIEQFLDLYNYRGGRLTSSEKLSYTPNSKGVSLELNFYTAPGAVDNLSGEAVIDQKIATRLKEIKSQIVTNQDNTSQLNTQYNTKSDPFAR